MRVHSFANWQLLLSNRFDCGRIRADLKVQVRLRRRGQVKHLADSPPESFRFTLRTTRANVRTSAHKAQVTPGICRERGPLNAVRSPLVAVHSPRTLRFTSRATRANVWTSANKTEGRRMEGDGHDGPVPSGDPEHIDV